MGTVLAGLGIAVALIGTLLFVSTLPVAILTSALRLRRTGDSATLVITVVMAAGFLASGAAAWTVLASPWDLSFLTTIEASLNSEKYGHLVEHAAENLLVAVLFFSVIGGLAGGAIARLASR